MLKRFCGHCDQEIPVAHAYVCIDLRHARAHQPHGDNYGDDYCVDCATTHGAAIINALLVESDPVPTADGTTRPDLINQPLSGRTG